MVINLASMPVKESGMVNTLKISGIGGDGGMIGIDKNSNISMEFNTPGMYRAYINKYGEKEIFLYEE